MKFFCPTSALFLACSLTVMMAKIIRTAPNAINDVFKNDTGSEPKTENIL